MKKEITLSVRPAIAPRQGGVLVAMAPLGSRPKLKGYLLLHSAPRWRNGVKPSLSMREINLMGYLTR